MVAQASVVKARESFHHALEGFVNANERANIEVIESPPGVLWANIGTDRFLGVPSTDRQEMIWSHLRARLGADELRYCWGVHCLDASEYHETLARRNDGGQTLVPENGHDDV
jgi:hypothetical protein